MKIPTKNTIQTTSTNKHTHKIKSKASKQTNKIKSEISKQTNKQTNTNNNYI